MAIYLDHNAGAPIRPRVQTALASLIAMSAANPASVHRAGQAARKLLEQARAAVGALIGAPAANVVFTSGGTEANNLAVRGAVGAMSSRRRIVSTAIEHSSVLEPLRGLERDGYEVVLVAPDAQGRVAPAELIRHLDRDTALLSVGLANSEVGTIQDVAPLAAAADAVGATFHIDAVAAAGRIAVDASALGCDLMTLSAHKLGAPAGVGALFVREPALLAAQTLGGAQEHGMRGGTPNLLGAVGFGVAARIARAEWEDEARNSSELAARLSNALFGAIPGLLANHPERGGLPNTLNFTFPGVLGETLLIALDLAGVEVSMGSACAAGSVEPSHVLLAMGRGAASARSSLRLSLGYSTTADEIERAAEIIPRTWRQVVRSDGAETRSAP